MLSHVANQQTPQQQIKKTYSAQSDDSIDNKHPYAIKKMEIKDPEYMSEVPEHLRNKEIPGFPSTTVCIGEPGSGKTNVLINLLTGLWKGLYDKIYFFGPTCKADKLYKHIKVDPDQMITNQAEFLPKLGQWTDEQIEEVERDCESAMKLLFVFEDITSFFQTLQTTPEFSRCFVAIRHHKASAYAHVHKIKAFNRTARMASQNIICFPVNKTEIDVLYSDWGPRALNDKQFAAMVEEAWRPDEYNKKPFLYINKYQPEATRYRKCFTHILNLDVYKAMDFSKKKETKERKGVKSSTQEGYSEKAKTTRQSKATKEQQTLREYYQKTQRDKARRVDNNVQSVK